MGNAMAAVRKRDRRNMWVKIMKIDGTVTKVLSPVYVKEVLADYPDHGIFEADAVRRLGVCCRPLQKLAVLEGGKMYFLIPLPRQASGCLAKSSSDRMRTASSRLQKLEEFRRAFSINSLSGTEFHGDETMKIRDVRVFSSGDEGSSLRVKMRLRKDELASIMSGKRTLALEDAVEKAIQIMKQKQQQNPRDSMSRPVCLGWKPKLDSIAESKIPSPARQVYSSETEGKKVHNLQVKYCNG